MNLWRHWKKKKQNRKKQTRFDCVCSSGILKNNATTLTSSSIFGRNSVFIISNRILPFVPSHLSVLFSDELSFFMSFYVSRPFFHALEWLYSLIVLFMRSPYLLKAPYSSFFLSKKGLINSYSINTIITCGISL